MLKDTTIKCRTVRRFTDEKIPLETLKELLVYTSMVSSNADTHPVEFIAVSEEGDMDYLTATSRFGAKHLVDVLLAVLIVANKDVRKCWAQKATMMTAYLDLLVQEENYRSGYLPLHDSTADKNADAEAYVRDYFNTSDNYGTLSILTIGEKDERIRARKEFPIDEKIHEDRFQNPFY